MVELKVDFCSYDAAKYAVTRWHYSKTMPAGKLVKIGVWENKQFIGCVLFGRGANRNIATPYNLNQGEVIELVRIALKSHQTNVTKIVSQSIKLIKKIAPKIKLIISYADSNQHHLGIIYQAGNWIYTGTTPPQWVFILNGKITHKKTAWSKFNTNSMDELKKIDPNCQFIQTKPKFKYIYPLNKMLRKRLLKSSKPYPKQIE